MSLRTAFETARLGLLVASALIALGVALSGSASRTVGGALVVAGWVLAVASLHRVGRAGPEPPTTGAPDAEGR